jgi:TolB-like protein
MWAKSHLVLITLLVGGLRAEAGQAAAADATLVSPATFKRRVLLTIFINENLEERTQYLAESVPAAFSAPLIKTENFIVLNRVSVERYLKSMGIALADVYEDANAVRLGKLIGADVVVVGKFSGSGDTVTIHAKAIDVQAGRLSVEDTADIKTNATMFAEITRLAERMSEPMAEKMQPLPEPPPPAELTLDRVEAAREAAQKDEPVAPAEAQSEQPPKEDTVAAAAEPEKSAPLYARLYVDGGISLLQPLASAQGQIDYEGKYPFSKLNPGFAFTLAWLSAMPRWQSLAWLESFHYAASLSYAFFQRRFSRREQQRPALGRGRTHAHANRRSRIFSGARV